MKFAYRRYDTSIRSPLDGSTEVYRPEIPVRLIGLRCDVCVLGLVDTGSDSVVIGDRMARRIGARVSRKRTWKVHGLGGQPLEGIRGTIDIEIVQRNLSLCWSLPVAVVSYDDVEHEEMVLLGQSGFLQFLNVQFRGDDRVVELKPNPAFRGRQSSP